MFNLLSSFILNLCEVVNGGVVDSPSSENGIPGNNDTNALAYPGEAAKGILIIILIILIAFFISLSIIYILRYKELKNTLKKGESQQSANIEENQLLSKYRELNEQEKKLINDTLTTLNNAKKE